MKQLCIGLIVVGLIILIDGTLHGQEVLRLRPQDVRIERTEGGLLLRVRKDAGISSLLLTESTRDPQLETPVYGLQNPEYHPTNGDERRILDGEFIDSEPRRYFLVDSTPFADPDFGEAFHIYIPEVVRYGYPWSRNGELIVNDGLFLNIRAFAQPYADYSGGYRDNPFVLRISSATEPTGPPVGQTAPQALSQTTSQTLPQTTSRTLPQTNPRTLSQTSPQANPGSIDGSSQPNRNGAATQFPAALQSPSLEVPSATFRPEAVVAFRDIASENEGQSLFSSGEQDVLTRIEEILRSVEGTRVDLVLAIDTTRSMRNDLPFLQRRLRPLLEEYRVKLESLRVGLVYYRDYRDEYLTRTVGFNSNLEYIQSELDAVTVDGGYDIPEAVYEALNVAVNEFPWRAPERIVILIGDAPPHKRPRGDIDRDTVYSAARARNIELNTIILPQ